jgi:transposase-like protein
VNQVRWDQWRQLIARQCASGLSVAEFCRGENISRQGFHVWKRKFRQKTSAPHRSAGTVPVQRSRKQRSLVTPRRQSRRAPLRPATPTAAPGFLQLPVTAVRPSPWIELALPDGTIVRLPQQNLAALVAVLRALRGERLELSEGAGGHA